MASAGLKRRFEQPESNSPASVGTGPAGEGEPLHVPSAYADGYAKAKLADQALADRYIAHTLVGDPQLDPILEELSSVPGDQLSQHIAAGVRRRDSFRQNAPKPLRDFFDTIEEPPPWVDFKDFRPAIYVFNPNSDLMLAAFVAGVLVEGFSTLIAKSFNITGRVRGTHRRLQQNIRQVMEIFYPGGLRRDGDGWAVSVRVRFVHGQIRRLLAHSGEWDHEAWGTPLSAANLGFAISIFSKRLLHYSKALGASFTEEERAGVLAVWRYTGYLMGIPESILYQDGAEADAIYKIGYMCEPTPDEDSVVMANSLIGAVPGVAQIDDEQEAQRIVGLAYRLSRALLGGRLANQFQYPKSWTLGALWAFRMSQRLQRLRKRDSIRSGNFVQLLQMSTYDEGGLSYRLPDHVRHEKSSEW